MAQIPVDWWERSAPGPPRSKRLGKLMSIAVCAIGIAGCSSDENSASQDTFQAPTSSTVGATPATTTSSAPAPRTQPAQATTLPLTTALQVSTTTSPISRRSEYVTIPFAVVDATATPSTLVRDDEVLLRVGFCSVPLLRAEIGSLADRIAIRLEVPGGGFDTCSGTTTIRLTMLEPVQGRPIFGVNQHGQLVGPLQPVAPREASLDEGW